MRANPGVIVHPDCPEQTHSLSRTIRGSGVPRGLPGSIWLLHFNQFGGSPPDRVSVTVRRPQPKCVIKVSQNVWIRAGTPTVLDGPMHSRAVGRCITRCNDPSFERAVRGRTVKDELYRLPAKRNVFGSDSHK